MMNSSEYWKKRFIEVEQAEHKQGIQCYADIERQYRKAQSQIESQIEAWYGRFADNNGITLTDARRTLNNRELAELKWDIQEYIRYGEENAVSGQWVKQLENASARFHISRLEAIRLQTQQSLEIMFGNQLDMIDKTMQSVYKDGFYRTAYEVQKGFGVGWDFGTLDEKQISKVINKPWAADGKNFSSRIWQNKQKLINELNTTLTQGIVLGQDPQKIIDTIARKLNTSKNNAGRLVMTEQAFFSEAAQHDGFRELGVELYEIVATLDSLTSDICQEMDGKKFKMSEWEVGVTAPPFHVNCRTTTVPAFDDGFDLTGERAARGKDGKTYYVPSSMTYKQWQKSFVDGNKSELQEVIPDDKIEPKKETIQSLDKLKKSGMSEYDYEQYLGIINNHNNSDIIRLYKTYADKIKGVKKHSKGEYSPIQKSLVFDYPKYEDMNKYGTLAHEYGHFFDAEVTFDNLHFNEIQAIQDATGLNMVFKNVASSSDEFLAAVRKDKEHLKNILSPEIKENLRVHNASHGVQDAIDGLFSKSRIRWGHGERYYNRKYSDIEFLDRLSTSTLSKKKMLQQIYKDLGLDASNQAKTKMICRQYEAASEMWANIMSAEICGGDSLDYIKKYLPNSYQALLDILKGVK